jgi:hypothetical protein
MFGSLMILFHFAVSLRSQAAKGGRAGDHFIAQGGEALARSVWARHSAKAECRRNRHSR